MIIYNNNVIKRTMAIQFFQIVSIEWLLNLFFQIMLFVTFQVIIDADIITTL